MPSTKLGRYEILEELGRGAMGQVFAAHDPQIDRKVAIKTVHTLAALPAGQQREARESFLREARAAAQLIHPGIVTLLDVGEADGMLYLAMELVHGTTLDHFCDAGNLLPVKTVIDMLAGVADTLDYAHRSGIVHRDLKPGNLMRVTGTSIKVMDFGLTLPSGSQLSHPGGVPGTPSYMSPEQVRGGDVDGRGDLFSLAVVACELLTGERPFPGDSVSSILYRVVHEEPSETVVAHPRVPQGLRGLLLRSLDKDPERRFGSGAEMAEALREQIGHARGAEPASVLNPITAGESVEDALSRVPPPSRRPHKGSSSWLWVFVVLAVIGGLGAAGFYYREQLGLAELFEPAPVWLQARIRTEPPGLPITLNGRPFDPEEGGLVRFEAAAPFGVLAVEQACRSATHTLDVADAETEIVLVLDPVQMPWQLDPGVAGASVVINGESLGVTPLALDIDLCRDNEIELRAEGYRSASYTIPAGATPLDARTRLADLGLEPIPTGKMTFGNAPMTLVYYLDGERLGSDTAELELPEGEYRVRIKNEHYFIDETRKIRVRGGETVTATATPPALTDLVVQAFPANCKAYLRRPGGKWKLIDETPLTRKLAIGTYELRVEMNATGETREQQIELSAGANPPVRVSFGRR